MRVSDRRWSSRCSVQQGRDLVQVGRCDQSGRFVELLQRSQPGGVRSATAAPRSGPILLNDGGRWPESRVVPGDGATPLNSLFRRRRSAAVDGARGVELDDDGARFISGPKAGTSKRLNRARLGEPRQHGGHESSPHTVHSGRNCARSARPLDRCARRTSILTSAYR